MVQCVHKHTVYNTFLYLVAGKNERDEGAKQNRHNLPKSIRLRANVLVNLRPAAGIQVIIIQLASPLLNPHAMFTR